MDGRTGQAHVIEVIINQVRLALVVDEDQSAAGRHGHQQVIQALLFERLVHVDNLINVSL